MKKYYLFIIIATVILNLSIVTDIMACHATAIQAITTTSTSTDYEINGSSSATSCGCGDYYMEVQFIDASQTFSANNIDYSSTIGQKPNCVLLPYPTIIIPLSSLCPGKTYKWRTREKIIGNPSVPTSLWSGAMYFTAPGTSTMPTVTLSSFTAVCQNTPAFTLTGGQPTGGVYSGTGVTNNMFDPISLGSGIYNITYTYTDTSGCSDSATEPIQVDAPAVTLNSFNTVCPNSTAFTLTGGQPNGGVYSGTGVSNNIFDPVAAGTGTYNITYTYTDTSGCSNSASQPIQVEAPAVALSNFSIVCANTPAFTLTGGQPANGIYSGTGVTNNIFDPISVGPGTYNVTYTYTDSSGCSNSATEPLQVILPQAVTLDSYSDVCDNTPAFVLTGGQPQGGVYSGAGVTNNEFDPTTVGTGTYSVTYTYTDTSGCINSEIEQIEVITSQPVTHSSYNIVCQNTQAFVLTGGQPSGGVYSGTGVTNNMFDPIAVGTGTYNISYTYTDTSGCSNSATEPLQVVSPSVTLNNYNIVCQNAPVFGLSGGQPTGGIYSGTGVSNNMFDPIATGTGTFNITYSYTDSSGCSNSATEPIQVIASPSVTLDSYNSICNNASAFSLTGGQPTGGVYSGTGVANNQFDPVSVGAGTYNITYTYIDTMGCSDSATETIQVIYNQPVTLDGYTPICDDAPTFTLTGGQPIGGIYSGPGVINNMFVPIAVGAGTYNITYTYTDSMGCSGSSTEPLQVNVCTGIANEEKFNSLSVKIYPFPANNYFIAEINSPIKEEVSILLKDINGRIVSLEKQILLNEGINKINFNTSNKASGIYFIQITNNYQVINSKIILVKDE